MAIWKINDAELEFDVTNADTMERYETALDCLKNDIPNQVKGITWSGYIRAYCKAHRKMYHTIFGENASEKIFAGIPDSLQQYNRIYAKLLAFVAEQGDSAISEMQEITETYAPESETENVEDS